MAPCKKMMEMTIKMTRSYSELRRLKTFEDRYEYLKLKGSVGRETFGFDRYLNQMLYKSRRWLRIRDDVIVRDEACDLGIYGYDIHHNIIIHHMNPISRDDIENEDDSVFDPEFLICTSHNTHMAIHYGDGSLLPKPLVIRYPGDTTPWLR